MYRFIFIFLAVFDLATGLPAAAGSLTVAVARNFEPTLRILVEDFEAETEHKVEIASGSTGKLYAQIIHGAPFDVFLAADQVRPSKLETAGAAVQGSRFTYAIGRLVLWDPEGTSLSPAALSQTDAHFVAIANPDLAPYGAAAASVIDALSRAYPIQGQLVYGEDVGQVFAFVTTGNAQLGFIAKSQILSLPEDQRGAYWEPDGTMYSAIRQDAVLLGRASENEAAQAFLAYLRRPSTHSRLSELGYFVP